MVKDLFVNPPEQQENPQRATFKFLSTLDVKIESDGTSADLSTYMVYPMGYELEDVERTLIGIISDAEDLEAYNDAADEAPYFQINGITNDFSSNSETYSFDDTGGPNCPGPDPITGIIPPCTKEVNVGLDTTGNDKNPRILGGRLGYIIRDLEKSLFPEESDFWSFIDSCETTEQFLLGQCGGRRIETRAAAVNPNAGGTGACVPVPKGPCSVENLKEYFGDNETKAQIASIICNRESRGLSYYADGRPVINNACTRGETADYSVGLFQINAMAHCRGAFSYTSLKPPVCTIGSRAALDKCVEEWLIPDNNIKKMVELSQGGNNWGPWAAAGACSSTLKPLIDSL